MFLDSCASELTRLLLMRSSSTWSVFFCPFKASDLDCLQVEMRKESDYYPRVVASPSDGKVTEELSHDNIF